MGQSTIEIKLFKLSQEDASREQACEMNLGAQRTLTSAEPKNQHAAHAALALWAPPKVDEKYDTHGIKKAGAMT